jgi:hypothetical protein
VAACPVKRPPCWRWISLNTGATAHPLGAAPAACASSLHRDRRAEPKATNPHGIRSSQYCPVFERMNSRLSNSFSFAPQSRRAALVP